MMEIPGVFRGKNGYNFTNYSLRLYFLYLKSIKVLFGPRAESQDDQQVLHQRWTKLLTSRMVQNSSLFGYERTLDVNVNNQNGKD